MAFEIQGIVIPMKAGGTIGRGCFVKLDSTNQEQVVVSAAEGDLTIGVAVEAGSSGGFIGVQINGVASVQFGGTVNVNAAVEAGSSGKAVAAAGAASATLGYALEGGASGTEGAVLLCTPVALGPANS